MLAGYEATASVEGEPVTSAAGPPVDLGVIGAGGPAVDRARRDV